MEFKPGLFPPHVVLSLYYIVWYLFRYQGVTDGSKCVSRCGIECTITSGLNLILQVSMFRHGVICILLACSLLVLVITIACVLCPLLILCVWTIVMVLVFCSIIEGEGLGSGGKRLIEQGCSLLVSVGGSQKDIFEGRCAELVNNEPEHYWCCLDAPLVTLYRAVALEAPQACCCITKVFKSYIAKCRGHFRGFYEVFDILFTYLYVVVVFPLGYVAYKMSSNYWSVWNCCGCYHSRLDQLVRLSTHQSIFLGLESSLCVVDVLCSFWLVFLSISEMEIEFCGKGEFPIFLGVHSPCSFLKRVSWILEGRHCANRKSSVLLVVGSNPTVLRSVT